MDLKNVESHTQIDISSLKAGLYIISLETEEEVLSQKFIKQQMILKSKREASRSSCNEIRHPGLEIFGP